MIKIHKNNTETCANQKTPGEHLSPSRVAKIQGLTETLSLTVSKVTNNTLNNTFLNDIC